MTTIKTKQTLTDRDYQANVRRAAAELKKAGYNEADPTRVSAYVMPRYEALPPAQKALAGGLIYFYLDVDVVLAATL